MSKKLYIHEGGSYGDFAFLEEVLEEDKIITLSSKSFGFWKREKVGPFCRDKKNTPTTYLYERLKDHYIKPGSKLDDALIHLVEWAERELNKLGHEVKMRDEL